MEASGGNLYDGSIGDAEREARRPDFLDQNNKRDNAAHNLRNAERDASSSNPKDISDTVDGAREEEAAPANSFINSVVGKKDEKNQKKNTISFLKKRGPIALILGLIFGAGGMLAGSQSMLVFSFTDNLKELTSNESILSTRSKTLLGYQVSHGLTKDPINRRKGVISLSNRQKTKLANKGIYYDEVDVGGDKKVKVLLYEGDDGKMHMAAANAKDVETLKTKITSDFELDSSSAGKRVTVSFESPDTVDNIIQTNKKVRIAYNEGSITWRGKVSLWFDSLAYSFLNSNALTRNVFRDFIDRYEETYGSGSSKKAVADAMEIKEDSEYKLKTNDPEISEETVEKDENGNYPRPKNALEDDSGRIEKIVTVDADGNEVTKEVKIYKVADYHLDPEFAYGDESPIRGETNVPRVEKNAEVKTVSKKPTKAEIKTKMDEIANSSIGKMGNAAGIANTIVGVASTAIGVMSSIQLVVKAQEALQIQNVAMPFNEAADKARAGDQSPINVIGNAMTTPAPTTTEELRGDTTETVVKSEGKSMIEAQGPRSLYSGEPLNPNDPSIANFNLAGGFKAAMAQLSITMDTFKALSYTKIAAAAFSATMDIVKIAVCAASFGIGCIVSTVVEAGVGIGVSVAVSEFAPIIVNAFLPMAVAAFTRDLATEMAGEDFGNAVYLGTEKIMSSMIRSGGSSLGSRDKVIEYKALQSAHLAEKAEYERATRSPFDISSPYTFLGSLVNQIITLGVLKPATTGVISTMGNLVSNSVVALLPTASAVDISSTMMTQEEFEETCPNLAAIGAFGDAFCNPYVISDLSTLTGEQNSTEAIVERVSENLYMEESDPEKFGKIKEGSDLANYILYCGNRTSEFGIADSNIASKFDSVTVNTGTEVFDNAANGAIGAIPVVGDILDIISNGEQNANEGWISGSNCVAGSSEDWEEMKYYQRYAEDQRLMEAMDDDYQSTVSLFLDEYYEQNPLDNSYEGILARYSGLPKDAVVAVLDFMEYQTYVAKYDPTNRNYFGEEEEYVQPAIEDNDRYVEMPVIASASIKYNVYADLRNRFTMAA